MTELDLGLKVAARRMLWHMGYTTRLNVALRSVDTTRPRDRRRSSPDAFTDLDVLGLGLGPGASIQTAIVDCKTSTGRLAERMFWIRGVADFFRADAAYVLREQQLTSSALQLATRLGVTAMSSEDLTAIEAFHPTTLPTSEPPMSTLFTKDAVAQVKAAERNLNRALRPLLDYRSFDFWVHDTHRNLTMLVTLLRPAAQKLDSRNPLHMSLFLDMCWLYLVTLLHSVSYVRRSRPTEPQLALSEYMLGGPVGMREKQQLSTLLDELQTQGAIPAPVDVAPLPPYFSMLLELATRVLRRTTNTVPALQQLEFLTATTAIGEHVGARHAFGPAYNELASKQAADVAGYLVTTADLDPGFRERARLMLLDEAPQRPEEPGTTASPSTQPSLLPEDAAHPEQPDPGETR